MLSTLLVAFDGSAHSEKPLRTVLAWGYAPDSKVHVVYVAHPEELQGIHQQRPTSLAEKIPLFASFRGE